MAALLAAPGACDCVVYTLDVDIDGLAPDGDQWIASGRVLIGYGHEGGMPDAQEPLSEWHVTIDLVQGDGEVDPPFFVVKERDWLTAKPVGQRLVVERPLTAVIDGDAYLRVAMERDGGRLANAHFEVVTLDVDEPAPVAQATPVPFLVPVVALLVGAWTRRGPA